MFHTEGDCVARFEHHGATYKCYNPVVYWGLCEGHALDVENRLVRGDPQLTLPITWGPEATPEPSAPEWPQLNYDLCV